VLDLWRLDELRGIALDGDVVSLGALTTYTDIRRSAVCREHLPVLVEAAATIGAAQIQNRGTIGGNVVNASPAGDTLPVLLAADASFVLGSARGERVVAAGDFWTAYRRTALAPDELLLQVRIPLLAGRELRFRKVGTRRAQSISKVVMALGWRDAGPATPRRPVDGCAVGARFGGADADPCGRDRGRPRGPARPCPRRPILPPRRWLPSSPRSTTSARRPNTAGSSRPVSCTGWSATRAAGDAAVVTTGPTGPTMSAEQTDATLLDIDELDVIAPGAFAARVAPLFEGARGFLGRLAMARPFGSADAMFATARTIAREMPEGEQIELIDAHPRLGAPPGSVSALSYVEQGYAAAAAQEAADAEAARVAAELERLNAAYEERFGFRYCVFVAGRPRVALLPDMAAALGRDRQAEIDRALDAVVDIARARYATLTAERTEDGRDRARCEPLWQGRDPCRPGPARRRRRSRARPDGRDRTRGRFRDGPYRR
jgi:2-oxo-4-hydroxy-4-carboxy--5-ureidoimidazoline (OHCU) decarboxylase